MLKFGIEAIQRANCSGIFEGAEISCADPLSTGLRQRLLLANLEDVEQFWHNPAPDDNVIFQIDMKPGKSFFEFEGVKASISCQSDIVNGSVSVGYDHTVNLSVFDVSAMQRLNLQAMAYKPQVAILQSASNDTSLGEAWFQLYGGTRGVEVLTNTRIDADADTGGAYVIQLKTSDVGGKESGLPEVIYDGISFVSTEALVNALLIPAP